MKSSIYKRKDGRWEGYAIYVDPDTGIEEKKSFYGKKRPDVSRELSLFIEKIESGDYSDIRKITLEGWFTKFIEVYCAKRELTTKEGYVRYINNHIIPFFGKDRLLKQIKPIHIEEFYNNERSIIRIVKGKEIIGYSEKTILQEHRILSRAFRKAVVNGLLKINPCDGVDAPSPEDYEPTIYTEDQYNLLLKKIEGDRMTPLILLAGMCGLRRGELMGLCWEDIDFANEQVHVYKNRVPTKEKGTIEKDPKSKKSKRTFSIPSVIIPSLIRYRGIGKIYTRLDGKQYHPGTLSKYFKEFLETNGLPHIRLHDLRHFNATMMLKHGVTERAAQERLGHSNPGQTKKYQHILKEMDKNSADKLNKVMQL